MALLVVTVLSVLSSVDWIAWLSLRDTNAGVRAAILSALTSLVLALGRAATRLLSMHRDARGKKADKNTAN